MHQITIKKSVKRSTWQATGNRHHEIFHLSWFEPILKPCLTTGGIDAEDNSIRVLFTFDDQPFDGYQNVMRRASEPEELREAHPIGTYYKLENNPSVGSIGGYVPPFLLKFFGDVPETLYVAFEQTDRTIFINPRV